MSIIEYAQSDLYHKCDHNDKLLERLKQEPDHDTLIVTGCVVVSISEASGEYDSFCGARCRRILRPYKNQLGQTLKMLLPHMAFIEKEQW